MAAKERIPGNVSFKHIPCGLGEYIVLTVTHSPNLRRNVNVQTKPTWTSIYSARNLRLQNGSEKNAKPRRGYESRFGME